MPRTIEIIITVYASAIELSSTWAIRLTLYFSNPIFMLSSAFTNSMLMRAEVTPRVASIFELSSIDRDDVGQIKVT
jgi:hypothetical protein